MDLYSNKSRSLPQKITIVALEMLFIYASYLVLFQDFLADYRVFGSHPHTTRNAIIFAFNIGVFARFFATMFVFLNRTIPVEEVLAVPLAFALYLFGFPLLAKGGEYQLGLAEALGVLLYLVGSFLNSFSEYQRHLFKKLAENKGKLYTGGLFALSMHINFFGDVLWVLGYAAVTKNPAALLIPAWLFCFFYFYNIPKLDNYLSEKYGNSFKAYEKNVKRLVPMVL